MIDYFRRALLASTNNFYLLLIQPFYQLDDEHTETIDFYNFCKIIKSYGSQISLLDLMRLAKYYQIINDPNTEHYNNMNENDRLYRQADKQTDRQYEKQSDIRTVRPQTKDSTYEPSDDTNTNTNIAESIFQGTLKSKIKNDTILSQWLPLTWRDKIIDNNEIYLTNDIQTDIQTNNCYINYILLITKLSILLESLIESNGGLTLSIGPIGGINRNGNNNETNITKLLFLKEFELINILLNQLELMSINDRRRTLITLQLSFINNDNTYNNQLNQFKSNQFINKQTNKHTNKQLNEQLNGQLNEQSNVQTDSKGWIDGFTILQLLLNNNFKLQRIERITLLRAIEEIGGKIEYSELITILLSSCVQWTNDEKLLIKTILESMGELSQVKFHFIIYD